MIDGDRGNTKKFWDKEWTGKHRHFDSKSSAVAIRYVVDRNPKTILDVGCGRGKLLYFLKDRDVYGIDISETAIKHLKEKFGLNGEAMNAYDIKNLNRKFDFIIANNILEHLYRYEEFLYTCKDILNKNGTMFVAVPNSVSSPEETEQHTVMFSRESLSELMEKVFGNCITEVRGNHLYGISICE